MTLINRSIPYGGGTELPEPIEIEVRKGFISSTGGIYASGNTQKEIVTTEKLHLNIGDRYFRFQNEPTEASWFGTGVWDKDMAFLNRLTGMIQNVGETFVADRELYVQPSYRSFGVASSTIYILRNDGTMEGYKMNPIEPW